jgi:hypothetical protein
MALWQGIMADHGGQGFRGYAQLPCHDTEKIGGSAGRYPFSVPTPTWEVYHRKPLADTGNKLLIYQNDFVN